MKSSPSDEVYKYIYIQVDLFQECKVSSTFENQCNSPFQQTENENDDCLNRCRKTNACNKIHYLVIVNTLIKLGMDGNFVNLTRGGYENHTDHIILQSERLECFLLRLGTKQECHLCHWRP